MRVLVLDAGSPNRQVGNRLHEQLLRLWREAEATESDADVCWGTWVLAWVAVTVAVTIQ
jgi:hypothetical protein